jgi:predicted nucleic acid-binding protein
VILLDSCSILEILFAGSDAVALVDFLDKAQAKGALVILPPLIRLECSVVSAVRFKEGKFINHETLADVLSSIDAIRTGPLDNDLTTEITEAAAHIKAEHGASMVDCYLIANAILRRAEVLTADAEIIDFRPARAKKRRVGKRFAAMSWRAR